MSFKLHNISVCFINTHLAPHMERYLDRNRMFEEIDANLRVGMQADGLGELDCSIKFDALFWIGSIHTHTHTHTHTLARIVSRSLAHVFLRCNAHCSCLSVFAVRGLACVLCLNRKQVT